MICRSTDPDEIMPAMMNAIGVGEGGDHRLLRAVIGDSRNVCLLCDGGGALFIYQSPGVYEGHSFFEPRVRGQQALESARRLISTMVLGYGATQITGETPIEHRGARMFNRLLGFKSLGLTDDGTCERFVRAA